MLIEQSAYANRWRGVAPQAKGLFALGGVTAAFVAAATPAAGLGVAALLAAVTIGGARVSPLLYLRVAAPALFFLAISALSLAVSVDGGGLQATAAGTHQAAVVATRSLGALAALLFLVLTTPLTDLIALLRRLRTPEVLLDIMVLCYRTLFVFAAALQDMRAAQAARLGHLDRGRLLHSLGQMAAHLTLQVWQRSHALHLAALARNNDGPLRFLGSRHAHARRDAGLAGVAALALVLLAWSGR